MSAAAAPGLASDAGVAAAADVPGGAALCISAAVTLYIAWYAYRVSSVLMIGLVSLYSLFTL
jgi:hypothetical protein